MITLPSWPSGDTPSRTAASSRSFYSAQYISLLDLMVEISVVRFNVSYRGYMKKIMREKLPILDEWLLCPLKWTEGRDVLELVVAKNKEAFTIFAHSMISASGARTRTIQLWPTP